MKALQRSVCLDKSLDLATASCNIGEALSLAVALAKKDQAAKHLP